jgi:hypothetical protein
MLHWLRERLRDVAEKEAAGESFWTPSFSETVRMRIGHVYQQVLQGSGDPYAPSKVFGEARRLIGSQIGSYSLTGEASAPKDFLAFYHSCDAKMFPTALEALVRAFDAFDAADDFWGHGYSRALADGANEVFAQERVGWELIDGQMVEVHSKELHTAVLEPALQLLHESRFAKADKQYRDALGELADNKAGNAITDAGTALQETLEALGCEGNQLGGLIRSAKNNQLLGAHDAPLIEAIEKSLHWAAADRSQMGDAHHATEATREDAWLIVHIVGALIVRLASGQPRTRS